MILAGKVVGQVATPLSLSVQSRSAKHALVEGTYSSETMSMITGCKQEFRGSKWNRQK
jgi:hypothetical protein